MCLLEIKAKKVLMTFEETQKNFQVLFYDLLVDEIIF